MERPNINQVWADLIVEELVRSGAGIFCIAPGSRSTPLAAAVAANPLAEKVVHYDERSTAFFALGYGRATHRAAVWITTSGTAVANGLPAVVEASLDSVPLILLTADRPPELRETSANQTIDQVKLFGGYVRWQFDLPAPDESVEPAMVLTTVDQAVYRTRRMPSGPVHLNCMFREPLAPDPDGGDYDTYLAGLSGWREHGRPYTSYAPTRHVMGEGDADRLWAKLRTVKRGIVVAGKLSSPAQADAVRWLAERLEWPLLPDVGSQLRLGGSISPAHAVPNYSLMLASSKFRSRCAPDAVLHVGGRLTSKLLAQFIAGSGAFPYVVVREDPSRLDPHHRVTDYVEADVVSFCGEMAAAIGGDATREDEWLDLWTSASRAADSEVDRMLTELDAVSEPAAARAVSRLIPEGSGLFLASSMPVRDVDMYGASNGAGPLVGANRGASGIDGTVASAAGFARGIRAPVTLLIGDLALLHDLNSLALLKHCQVAVVAINNHGGGIFSFLPIARHRELFEPYFGTPHDLGFEHAAAMFGIEYRAAATMEDLERSYTNAMASGRSCLIEITTDREENVQLHRRLEEGIAAVIS